MSIFPRRSKAFAIFNFKCPRCHRGDLFETGSFSFSKPFEMPERCPHCGFPYLPEPGFYYGSMFISYIISGFFCLGFVMFFHWVLDWGLGASFALLIAFCAVIFVWFFRFSRSLWINMIYRYDPTRDEQGLE